MAIHQRKPISPSFILFMNTIQQYFYLSFPLEKNKNKIQKQKHLDYQIIRKLYQSKYTIYNNTNLSKQRKAERDYYHEQFEIHKHYVSMFMHISHVHALAITNNSIIIISSRP